MEEFLNKFVCMVIGIWIWFTILILGAMPFVAAGYAIYMWWR